MKLTITESSMVRSDMGPGDVFRHSVAVGSRTYLVVDYPLGENKPYHLCLNDMVLYSCPPDSPVVYVGKVQFEA